MGLLTAHFKDYYYNRTPKKESLPDEISKPNEKCGLVSTDIDGNESTLYLKDDEVMIQTSFML